jgi:hypothetical protein
MRVNQRWGRTDGVGKECKFGRVIVYLEREIKKAGEFPASIKNKVKLKIIIPT